MKKLIGISAALLSLSTTIAFAQCNSAILDEANALNGTDRAVVQSQANKLTDAGLQPHVIVLQSFAAEKVSSLEAADAKYEGQCPNWMDGSHRQGNLFVLIHSIGDRKFRAFYGGSVTQALGSSGDVDHLLANAAVPFFKHGQYGNGYAAIFRDVRTKYAGFHDLSSKPVQKTTIINQNQNDGTASSHAVEWVFGLLFLAGLIGLAIWLWVRRSQSSADTQFAQQKAVTARQSATSAFRNADKTNPGYLDLASQFSELSNQVSYDPSTPNQTTASYNAMAETWDKLALDLRNLRAPQQPQGAASPAPTETPKAAAAAAGLSSEPIATFPGYTGVERPYTPPTREYIPTQPSVVRETTVIHERDNSNDMLTGMLVGEAIANNNRDEREYRREEPREESSYSSPSYSAPAAVEEPQGQSNDLSYAASSNDDSDNDRDDSSNNNDSSNNDQSYDDNSSNDDNSGGSFDDSSSNDNSY